VKNFHGVAGFTNFQDLRLGCQPFLVRRSDRWADVFWLSFSLNVSYHPLTLSYYPLTSFLLTHTPILPSSFHHLTILIRSHLVSSYHLLASFKAALGEIFAAIINYKLLIIDLQLVSRLRYRLRCSIKQEKAIPARRHQPFPGRVISRHTGAVPSPFPLGLQRNTG
jgi:hypothetical protein